MEKLQMFFLILAWPVAVVSLICFAIGAYTAFTNRECMLSQAAFERVANRAVMWLVLGFVASAAIAVLQFI